VTGFGYNIGTTRHIVNMRQCPFDGSQLFSGVTESRRQDGDMKKTLSTRCHQEIGSHSTSWGDIPTTSKNDGVRAP